MLELIFNADIDQKVNQTVGSILSDYDGQKKTIKKEKRRVYKYQIGHYNNNKKKRKNKKKKGGCDC